MSRYSKGFLLFEVMITVAVLSIGLIIIIRSFISCLDGTKAIVSYIDAGFYLEKKMWDIENGLQGTYGEDEKYKWKLDRSVIEDTDLSEAVLSVSWDQNNIEKKLTLTTYLERETEE